MLNIYLSCIDVCKSLWHDAHVDPPIDTDIKCFTKCVNLLCHNGAFFNYFKRMASPADGHCLMHSILFCLRAKYGVSNHRRLQCVSSRLLTRRLTKISKLRVTGPLCGEFTVDLWIPHRKGQSLGKCFHLMTSSCISIGIMDVPVVMSLKEHLRNLVIYVIMSLVQDASLDVICKQ